MSVYIIYDAYARDDAAGPRKVRVEKHLGLDDAKRSAQERYLRYSCGLQPAETQPVQAITVETIDGEIVYEMPESASVGKRP